MTVLFLHPCLTIGRDELAEKIYAVCWEEVKRLVAAMSIETEAVLARNPARREDAVLFFNRSDQDYDPDVQEYLADALDRGASVIPVGISTRHLTPPSGVSSLQSFDIAEQLRVRGLSDQQIETVAMHLARQAVTDQQPTLNPSNINLFISYRRSDGDELAAVLYAQVQARAQDQAFRDRISIQVGANAQKEIDDRLRTTDVVVFLDTPKAGESKWIRYELEQAMALNIPIIWVRVESDANEPRTPLEVAPFAAQPHIDIPNPAGTVPLAPDLADEIISVATRMFSYAGTRVFDSIRRLTNASREYGFDVKSLDGRSMLYEVQIPRKGFRYRQRPMVHLTQMFGRRPKPEDVQRFRNAAVDFTATKKLDDLDAALLLGPFPPQVVDAPAGSQPVLDSCDAYLSSVIQYLDTQTTTSHLQKRGIILSGSFPDTDLEYHQALHDALHAFARGILRRAGVVIFGGHPSFMRALFGIAKECRPNSPQEGLHLYRSLLKLWPISEAELADYKAHATTFLVDAVDDDRDASLTAMRKKMIKDRQAVAMVVMGGKTRTAGYKPGVDEEIQLARKAGLPVFLLGSTGGRSAELASEHAATDWAKKWNYLTPEENHELLVSLNYGYLCDKLLKSLGL